MTADDTFTFCIDSGNVTSCIDHVVCTSDIDKLICSMEIKYDFITSDHKPLLVKFSQLTGTNMHLSDICYSLSHLPTLILLSWIGQKLTISA